MYHTHTYMYTDIIVKFHIILKTLQHSCSVSILLVHCELLTSIGVEPTEHIKRATPLLCKLWFINLKLLFFSPQVMS